MSWFCIDCGKDTTPPLVEFAWEDYMVHDQVWVAAGMDVHVTMPYGGGGDFLCIGCLERRLGRKLSAADFTDAPINNRSSWDSPRLADRKARSS